MRSAKDLVRIGGSVIAAVALVACDGGGKAGPADGGPMGDGSAPDASAGDPMCDSEPGGDGVYFPEGGQTCEKLSSYRLISLDGEGNVVPNEDAGVLPYDLNTPLFTDYAKKTRTVWMPDDVTGDYNAEDVMDLPVGTIITKTFAYPADIREPDQNVDVIETRLLIHRESGWDGLPYIWNEDQTEAFYSPLGDTIEVSWTHFDGETKSTDAYAIPNENQCLECHSTLDESSGLKVMGLIGPKAKHINKDFDYGRFFEGDGAQNQLARWTEEGYLQGTPSDPATAPRLPVWNDSSDGSLHERARAYLSANCAHCHQSNGTAAGSGLLLTSGNDVPVEWGVCQGLQRGIGGDVSHNIVPGNPDASAIPVRMNSTDPAVAMPRLARSVNHNEGVQLIRDWVEWLGTQEAADQLGLDPTCWEPTP